MFKKKLKFLLVFCLLTLAFTLTSHVHASTDKEQENLYSVYLKSPNNNEDFLNLLKKHNIEVTYKVDQVGLFQVKSTQQNLEILSNEVNYIDSYNSPLTVQSNIIKQNSVVNNSSLNQQNNSLWDLQWDMQKVTNNGLSYQLSSGSRNTVVGIIDSGIDFNHPDLKGNILSSENFVPRGGLRGTEPNENGEMTFNTDYLGHGTFVAGQIAANGLIKGVAPNIGIKSYRVFGSKNADSSWIINAIIKAANDNVDVINLSLSTFLVKGEIKGSNGVPQEGDFAEIKAYKKAIAFAHKKGSIVVSSIGNEGLNLKDKNVTSEYWKQNLNESNKSFSGKLIAVPAQLPNVVTVSSLGPTEELSNFSNFGNGIVDIATYGGDMRLLKQYGEEKYFKEGIFLQEFVVGAAPGGTYTYSVGTSIATPKVAGTLALIIDKYHLHKKPDKVVHILKRTAKREGDKAYTGSGIVNVYYSLLEKHQF